MTSARAKRPREPDEPNADGLTVLHRARIVPWSVAAVTCIAACPDGSVFAAGYDDGKVEVFDASHFNRVAVIPGSDSNEVSGLAWARAPGDPSWRLFASTLGGQLLELSPTQAQPLAATDSGGGPIWCLQAAPCSSSSNGGSGAGAGSGGAGGSGSGSGTPTTTKTTTRLAAACGDGSVKLFALQPQGQGGQQGAAAPGGGGAVFERSLPRVEGNVLALAWHPDGGSIVSGGSDGCIHIWDAASGKERQRITAGTSSAAPPCVWALAVLPDGTIVSADQEGAVQFWDGGFGTLISRHQQFVADVLALAASPDGQVVWASGVDPKVAMYQRVPDKATGTSRWAYLDRKQPHTHDVRALAPLSRPDADPLLLSGGNDGQLVLYSMSAFLKQHPIRQSKAPQRPLLALSGPGGASPAASPPLLARAQQRTVDVWQLGAAAAAAPSHAGAADTGGLLEGDQWDLAALPTHLASITTSSSSHIIAAAVAPDGAAVTASDRHKLRLFRLDWGPVPAPATPPPAGLPQQQQRQLVVSRVKVQQPLDAPVVACVFGSDGRLLFGVTGRGTAVAVDAASGKVLATRALALPGVAAPPSSSGSKTKQQQQQQQAVAPWCSSHAWAMPAASHLAVSPDGRLLAVASASGVCLLSAAPGDSLLTPVVAQLSLLGEPAPITALAFDPSSAVLAVATAANTLAGYEVATGLPTPWSLQHQEVVGELLEGLPGSIQGLSFQPLPLSNQQNSKAPRHQPQGQGQEPQQQQQQQHQRLVVSSPGGLCHLDMAAPLSLLGGAGGSDEPAKQLSKQQRKQQRKQQGRGGSGGGRAAASAQVGRNGRLLQLQHCCLLVGHLSGGQALLLEKPWAEVLQGLVAPLYRHRYGS